MDPVIKPTMQQTAFALAIKEIGQKEIAGAKDNPRIIEYHSSCKLKATHDEIAWCSAFVNWCITKARGKGTDSAMARSWLIWGNKAEVPQAGDIVVFKRGNNGISGHVGFVAKTPKWYDIFIKVIGGNQSNMVCQSNYLRSSVLGYRRA